MKTRKELPNEVLKYFKQQGSVGGKTRAANLTPKERSEAARKAVLARWNKARKERLRTAKENK